MRRAAQVLRPDFIGANGLNLVEHILLARHANGNYKYERGSADHHTQGGQDEADLIAAKSVEGKGQYFANGHVGPKAFGHKGSSHVS